MVTTQGYANGFRLREEGVFPADVLSEDLCGLCDHFGIQCSWRGPPHSTSSSLLIEACPSKTEA